MILAFIGTTELLLIAALALLLFGGKKLPELMRGLGKGVREFKEGVKEVSNITEDTTTEAKQENKEE
ncbi:sec-independent protein translocase protein TatA 2 [Bacteroides sp. CAG:927]|jgi:twin arginine-targeting protein translocase, tatA/E family|nr:sec-independent protein translocase protein TatA 2 [Bacteroides sp. CAG:927]